MKILNRKTVNNIDGGWWKIESTDFEPILVKEKCSHCQRIATTHIVELKELFCDVHKQMTLNATVWIPSSIKELPPRYAHHVEYKPKERSSALSIAIETYLKNRTISQLELETIAKENNVQLGKLLREFERWLKSQSSTLSPSSLSSSSRGRKRFLPLGTTRKNLTPEEEYYFEAAISEFKESKRPLEEIAKEFDVSFVELQKRMEEGN